jgi:hypothetical protein
LASAAFIITLGGVMRLSITTRFKNLFAAGAVSAALAADVAGQVPPVKPEDASKHFAAVSKHLELGGLYFNYMDVDGDLAALGAFGDRLLNLAKRETPDIPKNLSAAKIIEALGLNSVKAIGMSSRSAGPDLYHNRALLYMPEGPKGLMKLFGGKAAPLQIASWAPADAGAAVQMDLTLSALLEMIESVLTASGQESVLAQYKMALQFAVPGLNMNAAEFIGKLNTRVIVAVRIDESKKLSVPGVPVEVPGVQFMLALDDVDFLMEPLKTLAEGNDNAVVENGEDFTLIRPNSSLPGELDYFKPGLYHDKKAKRLILTSHLEMARAAGKGDALAGSESFKQATAGLPAEGNGLTYATPQFAKAVGTFTTEVLQKSVQSGGTSEAGEELTKLLLESMASAPAGPMATVYANVPEGMLFMSNTNSTHKGTMLQLGVVPVVTGLFAAGAASGYQSVMERSRAAREEAERSTEEAHRLRREIEGDEAPDKAVKNNLQQIAFAAQTWFIDHPGDKEVTYETLVKNELIFDLDPVSGESYKGLTLKRAGGELSVKLKGGASISHKYQSVTD